MASNPLECNICCNAYNEDHCPRILPCSHTFCGPCIDELISIQKKECATCRKKFTTNSAEDLMIIRDLLDAAKQLPSKHAGSKTSPRELKKPFLETTKLFLEDIIGKGITVCEETEVEVIDGIESNNKMRGGLEGFIQTLEEINLSSKEACSNFSRDNKLLMDKLDIMLQRESK
ncbi:nuclear factor 7, ovary-like isoform X2 [Macrobrachium rosenbergii]|uniref:nuclear factor 7, ovary-like isoform X2 n=1 Tax=Macrobrachium rosenbergii TaxID=79674 RepID=UPI0034D65877